MQALLLVAFFLLTSAATADAECAWVLWNEVSLDSGQVGWVAVQAETTKRDCDLSASGKVKEAASDGAIVKGNIVRPQLLPLSYRFVCFPDTVDPRGPKGK